MSLASQSRFPESRSWLSDFFTPLYLIRFGGPDSISARCQRIISSDRTLEIVRLGAAQEIEIKKPVSD